MPDRALCLCAANFGARSSSATAGIGAALKDRGRDWSCRSVIAAVSSARVLRLGMLGEDAMTAKSRFSSASIDDLVVHDQPVDNGVPPDVRSHRTARGDPVQGSPRAVPESAPGRRKLPPILATVVAVASNSALRRSSPVSAVSAGSREIISINGSAVTSTATRARNASRTSPATARPAGTVGMGPGIKGSRA